MALLADFHNGAGLNPSDLDQRIECLCAYIESHLTEPLNLADLCRESGMTHPMLQTAFARRLKSTPMQWIRRRRHERLGLFT